MKHRKVPDSTTRVSLPQSVPLPEHAGKECLIVLYGGSIGRKYDLGPGHWTNGRDPYANIVLDADSVSRAHARIEIGATEAWVVDQGSTNGTFVNDLGAERARLRSGDLIKIGDIIHALRVAVTGKGVGLGMFEALEILGKERCLTRIDRCLERVQPT